MQAMPKAPHYMMAIVELFCLLDKSAQSQFKISKTEAFRLQCVPFMSGDISVCEVERLAEGLSPQRQIGK